MIVLTLSEVIANQSSGASPCRIPPTMDPSCWDYVRVLRLRGFMEKKKGCRESEASGMWDVLYSRLGRGR